MGLLCPKCQDTGDLRISASLEMPADARSDEITIQLVECQACEFRGVAVYEESRRGGLNDESVDHYGYALKAAEWRHLAEIMRGCPKPRDPKCGCSSHKKLNRRDKGARWQGLREFDLGDHFRVIYRK